MGKRYYNPLTLECVEKATIRTARKDNLYASVTTIKDILANFGITNYMIEEAIKATEHLKRLRGEEDRPYFTRVKSLGKEDAAGAADKGNAIHNLVERFIISEGKARDNEILINDKWIHYPVMDQVYTFLDDNYILKTAVAEEVLLMDSLRTIGRCDLYIQRKTGQWEVLDVKSQRQKDPKRKLKEYPDWIYQLAAYSTGVATKLEVKGLIGPTDEIKASNLIISSIPERVDMVYKLWTKEEKAEGLMIFQLLSQLFYLMNKHQPKSVGSLTMCGDTF